MEYYLGIPVKKGLFKSGGDEALLADLAKQLADKTNLLTWENLKTDETLSLIHIWYYFRSDGALFYHCD